MVAVAPGPEHHRAQAQGADPYSGGSQYTCLHDFNPMQGRGTKGSRPPAAGGYPGDMSTQPEKPSLDGLEDKWTLRWAKERVVQV
jgi:hypothetical protein